MDCDKCPRICSLTWCAWLEPCEIRYCPEQSRWLLERIETLQSGHYPQRPADHVGKRGSRNENAPFVSAVELSAELKHRLERTGTDGKLLLAQVRAQYHHLDYEAWRALVYMSGRRRKHMDYRKWSNKWAERKNVAKTATVSGTS